MSSTQQYYFANQSKIMLQDYVTFNEAAVLYQEQLFNQYKRVTPHKLKQKLHQLLKAESSIINTFGFFLRLNTQRTFWRAMELTVDAFVLHVEKFNQEFDGQVVLTDDTKGSFLRWLAHFVWSVQLAQYQLDRLRAIQLEIYQHNVFPFFPYSLKVLEEDSDVHLVIAKLCKSPVHDLPRFSALFSKLSQASAITDQMQEINAEFMAAVDELSTRFRFLETLILVAHLIATKDEIRSAIDSFKFNSRGKEVKSCTNDVMFILTGGVDQESDYVEVPERLSFLQELIVKENLFREKNQDRILLPPIEVSSSNTFPRSTFDAFKSHFRALYLSSIRRQWREDESSLLALNVVRRFQHRRQLQKEKKKRGPVSDNYEKTGMEGVHSAPEKVDRDPSLFWAIGDGSLEKYVAPIIRNKIKTRKEDVTIEKEENTFTGDEGENAHSMTGAGDAPGLEGTPQMVHRPLHQLKHTDLITRDILWRKIKGTLKWSQLVQFLSRLGCKILNLDGSKLKIMDTLSGRCTVLHRPHPGDECRPDQRESYRVHIEDWLKIKYSHVILPDDSKETEILGANSCTSTATTRDA